MALFWNHLAISRPWAPVNTILTPCEAKVSIFYDFRVKPLVPCGFHFVTFGCTFSFPGASEAGNMRFLGRPRSMSDFDTNSGQILSCLGWLKQSFRVEGLRT